MLSLNDYSSKIIIAANWKSWRKNLRVLESITYKSSNLNYYNETRGRFVNYLV